MRAMRAEVIRDIPGLNALVPHWWELWCRGGSQSPFESPVWLKPWWDVFAPGQLAVVAVWQGDELVGVAPLYLETGPLGMRLLPVGIGISDYCDVLLDPRQRDHVAVAVAGAIDTVGPWEICEFGEVAPDANVLALPCPPGAGDVLADASICPVLTAEGGRTFAQVVPQSRQRHLRQARRRVAKKGEISIIVGDADNSEAMLADLVNLHTACWNIRGAPGVFADPRVAEFHSAVLPGLMQAGLARLYALVIKDSVAAVYYGLKHSDRAYLYLQGFDPDLVHESPGSILVGYAIEQAIGEGVRECHFLRGDEAYKYEWGAVDRRNKRRVFTRGRAPLP